ncbi:tyrosine-type recombinase/integrase [Lactobacillus hominis]|uniref:tyrosine-type recombinase/integrase n=1 Tax=Lactobacillus hominis TaxID=1203033 RepID=UPI0023F0033F|nr:site-specific integrase [Lactobacillus hominis]
MPKRDKNIKEITLKSGAKRYKYNTYIGLDPVTRKRAFANGTFRTYNEAKQSYDEVRAKGTKNYVKPKQKTVDDIYKVWFPAYQQTVKESTANKTKINYKVHIKPWFKNDYIDKINPIKFQKWVNELYKDLVKYKEVINRFGQIYDYASSLGYCERIYNPVNAVIIPKKTKRHRRNIKDNFYTLEQLQAFLKVAKKQNYRSYTYFLLLATTGLRKSEALALKWSDIDWDAGTVSVTKTLAVGIDNKLIVQTPKSLTSDRPIPLSKNMITVLKKYREKQNKIYSIIFHGFSDNYVNLSKPDRWLTAIYNADKSLKKITIHGFRHTYATLNKDQERTDVEAVMGHNSLEMTEHYTHATASGMERIRDNVNELDIK